jgi:hypothetical protein
MPAVTEEFTSRVFSIPLFTKIFRSRWIGVILPAFIWGFGHSAYPNQPFFIRGLEVGLAGCLIGLLMLRFNVMVLLIWHYTVDALYSGYLLLRSGDPYYVATTAIAGGIFVLPFLIALVAYLRSGRFTAPDALRHAAAALVEREAVAILGQRGERAQLLFARPESLDLDLRPAMAAACELLDGRGGGPPARVQGAGSRIEALGAALEAARDRIHADLDRAARFDSGPARG